MLYGRLSEVLEVLPGVWAIPAPLPMERLPFALVYAILADDGVYLIDSGWHSDASYDALRSGLNTAETSLSDVRGVLITHSHPDHIGLAARIRDETGAWLGMQPAEARLMAGDHMDRPALLAEIETILRDSGASDVEIDALVSTEAPGGAFTDRVETDLLLEDGAPVPIPGCNLRAVWTPGHTPGHLCFHLPEQRVVFTGDHVLPRITPGINISPQNLDNPLAAFLRSLRRIADLDAKLALPAHEGPFEDVTGRIVDLVHHHEVRQAEILDAVRQDGLTAWQIAPRLSWSRPWSTLDLFHRRAALLETMAHLTEAAERGALHTSDRPTRWRAA